VSSPGISAIIITLNEERNIGRCLESLQGIADEIIVVDSHSTDRTRQIAEAHGARVIERDWEGYSATKNRANADANHAYILSLDADEALDNTLRASMLAAKHQGLSGSYSFHRLTNYCGRWIRHGGWYPDTKVRLFPLGAAEWQGNFVHEELVLKTPSSTTLLKGDLLHYSYYTREEHLNRVEKYTTLAAQKLKAKGKKGGTLKALASALARFFNMYVVKLGFMDGAAGWHVCRISAYAAYLRYTKLARL